METGRLIPDAKGAHSGTFTARSCLKMPRWARDLRGHTPASPADGDVAHTTAPAGISWKLGRQAAPARSAALLLRDDAVAHSGLGHDELGRDPGRIRGGQLAAQARDVDMEVVGLVRVSGTPDRAEQPARGHDPAGL